MGGLTATLCNRSARLFALIGIVLTAAVFIGTAVLHRYENKSAAAAETEYRLALAGRLSEYGLTDAEAAEIVTAAASPESISAGERILSSYGYSAGSPVGGEYAYSGHLPSEILSASGVVVFLAAGMICLYSIFRSIRRLTDQLEHGEKIICPDEHDTAMLAEAAAALRKQTEYLIGQINEEKQYLADYLNDFSHQIKTPCTGLMLNNDILSSAPMDFDEQLGYFRRDRKCLERISLLVAASRRRCSSRGSPQKTKRRSSTRSDAVLSCGATGCGSARL